MKLSYKFSALCGVAYTKGNLIFTDTTTGFTSASNALLSIVNNRVSQFDLLNHQVNTFEWAMKKNIRVMALSPNSLYLVVLDEDGRGLLINYQMQVVLAHFNLKQRVKRLCFSPDSRYFVVGYMKMIQVWKLPEMGTGLEFTPLKMMVKMRAHFDQITSIDWSSDGHYLLTASKDMSIRVSAFQGPDDYTPIILSGHKDEVIGAYFSMDMQIIYSVNREGAMYIWKWEPNPEASLNQHPEYWIHPKYGKFALVEKKYFHQVGKITSVAFHKEKSILCAGTSTGVFSILDLPSFIVLQSMNLFQHKVNTLSFNVTGEWIAFGNLYTGTVVVWEWSSETFILKQQGRGEEIQTLDYSQESQTLATGHTNGCVKLWHTDTHLCYFTWAESLAAINAVAFTKKGRVLLAAGEDGVVRAYDLIRYRQFRDLAAPTTMSFQTVTADPSGELVLAAGWDPFEVYIWSLQTGQLLDSLTGHEGPVTALSFDPLSKYVASGSLDKTIRLWTLFGEASDSKLRDTNMQTWQLGSEVLDLCFRPDGKEIAVTTLDGLITFWHPDTGAQIASIDGGRDAAGGRRSDDRRTAAQSTGSRHFTRLCFSADSMLLIAAGDTKYICIYDSTTHVLLKQFSVSVNLNLDGTQEKLNSSLLAEYGRKDLVRGVGRNDQDELYGGRKTLLDDSDDDDGRGFLSTIPGISNDVGVRTVRPEIRTKALKFSPDGRAWAAATTEGLQIYSLDEGLVFDPLDLSVEITPETIQQALKKERNPSKALLMAIKLNQPTLLEEVLLCIPEEAIATVIYALPTNNPIYMERVLGLLAELLTRVPLIQQLLTWVNTLLKIHGSTLRKRLTYTTTSSRSIPIETGGALATLRTHSKAYRMQNALTALRSLHKSILHIYAPLSKLTNENRYLMQAFIQNAQVRSTV